jgi:ATP-dependent helicase/nuclease subunit A
MTLHVEPTDQAARDRIKLAIDRNMCVEAGAGTGKTTSLVRRIVEILASGHADVDSLVVITFTEKAAAELSARVREALEAAVDEETDVERGARLREAARALYRARIETIHAFAANLLRERPVEAGIDPGFSVLSDLEAQLGFDRAYSQWLDELMEQSHPDVERSLNLGFSLDEIREAAEVLNRYRFLMPLQPPAMPRPDAAEMSRWLTENRRELQAIEGRSINEEDKSLPGLRRLQGFADRMAEEGDTDLARERLVALVAPSLRANAGKQSSWDDAEDCRLMKSLVGDYVELRDRLRDELRSVALLGVLPHGENFVTGYEDARRRDGVADYDDLLIWTRDLLRDNLEVRSYFQRRFRALLIDEFQDTDPIQVEIAAYLTSDGQTGTDWRELVPAAGKLFVVGDPKQSIYRFRRADIAIYDEVKRGLLAGAHEEIVQNFRSLPAVIEWINRVFDALLIEEPGRQPGNVPLVPQPSELSLHRPPVVVVRHIDDELNADGVRSAEARAVASLLRSAVIDQPWQVRERGAGEVVRPARWRDIAILLPTRTGLEAYEQALALAGVPYRHEGSRDYFQRQEVRDLTAILRAIDDPTDRFSLVGALRSSAFGCSDEDVVVHVAGNAPWDYRVERPSESAAVAEAFELLRELHRLRGRASLPELVQTVVERSRLVEFALTLPEGAQAAANLLAIVDQARSFSAAGGGGLRAFARWLVDSTENEAMEVDAGIAEETDDVVRLLTIHGAKGLEFPIVVLANLASAMRSVREPVPDERAHRLHFRVGAATVGRTGHYATPGYDDKWNAEKAALDAEKIRLLYVAATRARDHLVVPYVRSKAPGPFLAALEVMLPRDGEHETEVNGVWLVEAAALEPPPVEERLEAQVSEEQVAEAAAARDRWAAGHAVLLREARRELPLTVASSMERSMRPLAAEAAHSGATLLVSEGPPLPVGDALHLVMERVTLPDGNDLDAVTHGVCAEAGLLDREPEVREMAKRCLASPSVQRALESDTVQREVPFTTVYDGGIAVGRVDLVYRGGDGLVVVDYKSDDVTAESAEAHALEHHSGQAEVYARALEQATGVAVKRVVFVFARAGVEVAVGVR